MKSVQSTATPNTSNTPSYLAPPSTTTPNSSAAGIRPAATRATKRKAPEATEDARSAVNGPGRTVRLKPKPLNKHVRSIILEKNGVFSLIGKLALAKVDTAKPTELERLVTDPDPYVRTAALRNPELPRDLRTSAVVSDGIYCLGKAIWDNKAHILALTLEDPTLPTKLKTASQANTPFEEFQQLSYDENSSEAVRTEIKTTFATHNANPDVLKRSAEDPNDKVNRALASNPVIQNAAKQLSETHQVYPD